MKRLRRMPEEEDASAPVPVVTPKREAGEQGGVREGLGVTVLVPVGVKEGVLVKRVPVGVEVFVGVWVKVEVGVEVIVGVGVMVRVLEGVPVQAGVQEPEGVMVRVRVLVTVGV